MLTPLDFTRSRNLSVQEFIGFAARVQVELVSRHRNKKKVARCYFSQSAKTVERADPTPLALASFFSLAGFLASRLERASFCPCRPRAPVWNCRLTNRRL